MVNIPVQPTIIVKLQYRKRQKSFYSKIFQNLFLYFDDFPFVKLAFFVLGRERTSIVSCAILSELVRWSLKMSIIAPMTKVSGYSASSILMATCVTLANLTGQHFSKPLNLAKRTTKKLLFKNLPKYLFNYWWHFRLSMVSLGIKL